MYITPYRAYQYNPQFTGKKKQPVNTSKLYDDEKDIKDKKTLGCASKVVAGLALGLISVNGPNTIQDINEIQESINKINLIEHIEPEQKEFATREKALEYAFKKIQKPLNIEKPYEYSVLINDNTNEIEAECKGDSNSVIITPRVSKIFYQKLGLDKDKYTALHGHPGIVINDEYSLVSSFSFADFRYLNNNDKLSTSIVVTKDGDSFLLRKKENFKQLDEQALKRIETAFDLVVENEAEFDFMIFGDRKKNGKQAVISLLRQKFWHMVAKKYNLEYETSCNNKTK